MLEVRDLRVDLDGTRVLEDVDLMVGAGRFVGLVGPNGAGKSTLIRAVLGLIAHQGEISIRGERFPPKSRRKAARLVAYVPQRPVLPSSMTVTDFVLLGRAAHHSYLGAETLKDRRVVAAMLERLELRELAKRELGHVSGGEAQRAVLARALVQEAPVLVMDEPTTSLDLGHGQRVLEIADELRLERGLCLLCSLHDLNFAAQYCEDVLVLARGRPVAFGPPEEVLTAKLIKSCFGASVEVLGRKSGIAIAPVRVTKKAAGQCA